MFSLTDRELEILKLMAKGLNNTQIGEKLCISKHTAKAHVSAIIKKFPSGARSEATYWAGKYNLF